MLAALFAAALFSPPLQGDDLTRDVLVNVCLPFVGGEKDRAPAEFLGFTVVSEEGPVVEMESGDAVTRSGGDRIAKYMLQLADDEGDDDGEVLRACTLQGRTIDFASARGAVRRPLEQAGFVAEPTTSANRALWTKGAVTVSVRQAEGRATVVRVTYTSTEE
ncbi:hypothetical protein [Brevundimonas sp. M20]|uniref:hypothetical protein n=1 Tax=Brevundimonas sp. M20 TaxID=2591463 RepID=UPI0011469F51|nr:hypothetical protein [Brevundimonas sp. M20]QDH73610.1 hypothetical protein FKQ52_09320 [Brevundimonas sp. M20]